MVAARRSWSGRRHSRPKCEGRTGWWTFSVWKSKSVEPEFRGFAASVGTGYTSCTSAPDFSSS
ncbi:hypothetical protein QQM39_13925 [Streptomyces sp. DT2A-34]|uniref:hypothetical protein n=1 Tax=Streptomyces sp. DT2A-34 TaxID=3051182 RepID=UPI00265C6F84|nr:hypothetical protein [Streptomyces sp. DT2A-34]MDO0911905.1 hypothetical protein [Streptomyces sp. DT2A-34]